jgi:hypothetical protein
MDSPNSLKTLSPSKWLSEFETNDGSRLPQKEVWLTEKEVLKMDLEKKNDELLMVFYFLIF